MMAAPQSSHPTDLAGSRVLVVGAARSGVALARFLLGRGARVTVTDTQAASAFGPEVQALGAAGVRLELGGHAPATFETADLVVVSPGVPLGIAPIAAARRRGVRVIAEVELASWFLRGRLVGITGTNGKSTTTALTAHLLEHAGIRAIACGNIGTPLVDLVAGDTPDHHYVVELSSFQLEGIETLRPRVAALLNLTPDHQDRYPDMRTYYDAKMRIFMNQRPDDDAVINHDDPGIRERAGRIRARRHPFSRTRDLADGMTVRGDALVLRRGGRDAAAVPIAASPLFGAHNLENVMTALLVADLCGVPPDRVEAGLRDFRGLPHRLERVRVLDGAAWFNDSKATNVGATLMSLLSFPGEVVLILGGKDKGGDFASLVPTLRERVRHVVLMGQARDAIAAQIGAAVPATRVVTMAEAIAAARIQAARGGIVLLAPGCASFDQYRNFEERGDDFRRRVLALPEGN